MDTKHYLQLLSFVLFLSLCTTIHAQSSDIVQGYYISSKGDSLSGQFYLGNLRDNVLKYDPAGGTNWKKLTPAEVKEVHGKEGQFVTSQLVVYKNDSTRIFLHRIVSGEYNLYEGSRENQVSLFFFNARQKPKMIQVNQLGLETQLRTYIGACAEKTNSTLRYVKGSMMRYFTQMNQCAHPEEKMVVEKTKTPRPRLGLGLSVGMAYQPAPSFSNVISTSLADADYPSVVRPIPGLRASFNITPALDIVAGLNFVNNNFKSDSLDLKRVVPFDNINPSTGHVSLAYITYYYRYINAVTLKHLEVPLSFRLCPRPYAKSGLVVTAGASLSFALRAAFDHSSVKPYRVDYSPYVNPKPTLEEGTINFGNLKIGKTIPGFHAGLGWRKQFRKKQELETLFQYFWSRDSARVNQASFDMIWQRFQLTASYSFQFINK